MKRLMLVTLLVGCSPIPTVPYNSRDIAGNAIHYVAPATYAQDVLRDAATVCASANLSPVLVSNVPDGWGLTNYAYVCQ